MSHPSMRSALVLACMVALAVPAAAAGSNGRAEHAALGTEHYYSSYGTNPANANQTQRAIAAEHYYSTYASPQPPAEPAAGVAVSQAPAHSMSSTLIAALLLAAAGIGVAAGRISARHRPRLRSHPTHEPSST
jgi:hypothetical protein